MRDARGDLRRTAEWSGVNVPGEVTDGLADIGESIGDRLPEGAVERHLRILDVYE